MALALKGTGSYAGTMTSSTSTVLTSWIEVFFFKAGVLIEVLFVSETVLVFFLGAVVFLVTFFVVEVTEAFTVFFTGDFLGVFLATIVFLTDFAAVVCLLPFFFKIRENNPFFFIFGLAALLEALTLEGFPFFALAILLAPWLMQLHTLSLTYFKAVVNEIFLEKGAHMHNRGKYNPLCNRKFLYSF